MNKCSIKWIDEHGQPTPDQNDAIGEVWVEEYYEQMSPRYGGRTYHHEKSQRYPICQDHFQRFQSEHLAGKHWCFEAY